MLLHLIQAVQPPAELVGLWTGILSVVTVVIVQVMKKISGPIDNAPAWVKSIVALIVSFLVAKLSLIIGAPIPGDLGGAVATLVNWAAAMGLHALYKAVVPGGSTA